MPPSLAAALALALSPVAGGCLCFDGLQDSRCRTDGDCDGGRVCRAISTGRRYCVLPGGDGGVEAGIDAAAIPCDEPTDCADGNPCTADECTPAGCAAPPVADGTPCGDDGFACTEEACLAGACLSTPDESACAGAEVCNPIAYAATPSGCGPAPSSLSLDCPSPQSDPMATETCTIGLGLTGEAGRIVCTATPRPLLLFEDDFENGFGLWTQVSPSPAEPSTDLGGGTAATAATNPGFTIGLDLVVTGLEVLCIDFEAAQEATAGPGESIAWWASTDGGVLSRFWRFDFAVWQSPDVMFELNRNACLPVSGASTLHLELELLRDDKRVYVDDVRISGLAAPLAPTPPLAGADGFDSLADWTTPVLATGGPALTSLGGNSVLVGEEDDYEIERTVDTTGCDVVDVDFDFGWNDPDNVESVEMLWSVDGTTFTSLERLNLGTTVPVWDPDRIPFPWFGLRRLTDLAPPWIAGVETVWFRFRVLATGQNRLVYVDNFAPRCADLPAPSLGQPLDRGDGTYTVTVTAGAVVAEVVCRWQTSNDGPFSDTAAIAFDP